MPIYREVTDRDVGKALFELNGKEYAVSSFIGRIVKEDVGKRVYLIGDILQIENHEQRDKRVNETVKEARCPRCEKRARVVVIRKAYVRYQINADGSIGKPLSASHGVTSLLEFECGGGHVWREV